MDFLVSILIMHAFVIIMALMFGALGFMFFTAFTGNETAKKVLMGVSVGLFVLMFVVMIFMGIVNPAVFGYGFLQDDFHVVTQRGNILWGEDSLLVGDGEGGIPTEIYRIHGIDLDTGKRLFRGLMGADFEIIGTKGSLVWVEKDRQYVGLDFYTGTEKIVLNDQTLVQHSPQLKNGIYTFDLNRETLLLHVTAKDGTELSIDPSADFPLPQGDSASQSEPSHTYEVEDDRIVGGKWNTAFSFSDAAKKQLLDGNGRVLNNDLFFLHGRFLQFDPGSERIFIVSTPTLDEGNNQFIVRCMTSKGALVWEIQSSALEESNFMNIDAHPGAAFIYKDQFILTVGNTLFSMNISDGHIRWKNRL